MSVEIDARRVDREIRDWARKGVEWVCTVLTECIDFRGMGMLGAGCRVELGAVD